MQECCPCLLLYLGHPNAWCFSVRIRGHVLEESLLSWVGHHTITHQLGDPGPHFAMSRDIYILIDQRGS